MHIDYLLDDIERRIDTETETELLRCWRGFWNGEEVGDHFVPVRKKTSNPSVDFPEININDTLESMELMLIREICNINNALSSNHGRVMNVRANYGTGIMPSLFGGELFIMERRHNTLPTTIPQGEACIDRILDRGIPDLNNGLGGKVFDTVEFFMEKFQKYPKIRKFVEIYHPDLQGPLDVLELIWGSEMFLAFYDCPEKVHAMLDLITRTYAAFMEKFFALAPERDKEYCSHWGLYIKGRIMLRNDSAINLSAAQYEEFAQPYDKLLLDQFNGGAIHFCGKGDHLVSSMCSIGSMSAINLSQPHLNNMDKVFADTVDVGKRIVGLSAKAVDAAERPLHGRVHKDA